MTEHIGLINAGMKIHDQLKPPCAGGISNRVARAAILLWGHGPAHPIVKVAGADSATGGSLPEKLEQP